ncbi:hypothetical protein ACJJTC_002310 [Scirpophaga incertulas]
MLVVYVIIGIFLSSVQAVVQNVTCPVIKPRELDWKALDGKWYIAAVATDLQVEADCAILTFNHMNSTDVSISWISNNTIKYYNGSVAITVDPNSNSTAAGDLLYVTYSDQKSESYSLLDVDYEHYAALFTCYDNDDGNSSTYEIWKLTRSAHLKESDAAKMDQAIAYYDLQDANFTTFNNTEYTCSVNRGVGLSSLLYVPIASVIALWRLF